MKTLFNLSLKWKFVALLLAASLTTAIAIGGGGYFVAESRLKEQVENNLVEPLRVRAARLAEYEQAVRNDLAFFASVRDITKAIAHFTKALEKLPEDMDIVDLQAGYWEKNPYAISERAMLDKADDDSRYSTLHSLLHPTIRAFLDARGYHDIFLIDPAGTVIYTVVKEKNFLTNVAEGELAETGLGRIFANAAQVEVGEVVFENYQPYAPSKNALAAFVGTPIYASARLGADPTFQGVLAVELPREGLESAIMAEESDSDTQTYLVRSDGHVLTDLASTPEMDAMQVTFDLPELPDGLASTFLRPGLGDMDAILAIGPASFFGEGWYLVTQQGRSGAFSLVRQIRDGMLMVAVPAILLIAFAAWLAGKSMSSPILAVDDAMRRMNDGDLDFVIPSQDRGDEIGAMAHNTDVFRQKLIEADAARENQKRAEEKATKQQEEMLNTLDKNVGAVVTAVSKGELRARVTQKFDDPTLNNLGEGVNRICDVVSRFLEQLEALVSQMSKGKLTCKIEEEFEGRFGEVCFGLNDTISKIGNSVGQIKATGSEMTTSIRILNEGSADLAERAESQAASLEETAATMEQITATIHLNAKNAAKATELAADTQKSANEGRTVVESAVGAMGEIESSSSKITDIISVIDSIAFQTNLLALNAAVEAARAGDAGKGFAVVASEVRTLAQRSAAAASDITDLITVSSAKVRDGVHLVHKTGDALGEIMESISTFSDRIAEISAASQEQSDGVAQISNSISHMDDTTQQNARMADQSATVAKSLSSMSDGLTEMMAAFDTPEAVKSTAAPPENAESNELPSEMDDEKVLTKVMQGHSAKMDLASNKDTEAEADQEWIRLSNSSTGTIDDDAHPHHKLTVAGDEWKDF